MTDVSSSEYKQSPNYCTQFKHCHIFNWNKYTYMGLKKPSA